MAENINIETTVVAWADIVIRNWLRKISELDIGASGELFDSFHHNVIANSAGVPERVEFAHVFWGIFSDMGVGKGVPYGSHSDINTRRRPKAWRSKQLFAQTAKLSEILADKFSFIAAAVIKESLDEHERHYASTHGSSISKPSSSGLTELDLAWMRNNGLIN